MKYPAISIAPGEVRFEPGTPSGGFNAIFAATGKCIRTVLLKNRDLRSA